VKLYLLLRTFDKSFKDSLTGLYILQLDKVTISVFVNLH